MSELPVLRNNAACLILDLSLRLSATDALERLSSKTLLRRNAEHRLVFVCKSHNKIFSRAVQIFMIDTRDRNKTFANQRKPKDGALDNYKYCDLHLEHFGLVSTEIKTSVRF